MWQRTTTEDTDRERDARRVSEFQPMWVVPVLVCCLSVLVVVLAVILS